jgi:hypothetical protein
VEALSPCPGRLSTYVAIPQATPPYFERHQRSEGVRKGWLRVGGRFCGSLLSPYPLSSTEPVLPNEERGNENRRPRNPGWLVPHFRFLTAPRDGCPKRDVRSANCGPRYNHVIPTGFQFGGEGDTECPHEKVEGAMNILDFRVLILDLPNRMKGDL